MLLYNSNSATITSHNVNICVFIWSLNRRLTGLLMAISTKDNDIVQNVLFSLFKVNYFVKQKHNFTLPCNHNLRQQYNSTQTLLLKTKQFHFDELFIFKRTLEVGKMAEQLETRTALLERNQGWFPAPMLAAHNCL